MKNMIKTTAALLCAVASMTGVSAVAQTMKVEMRDGNTMEFATADIEKVTFTDVTSGIERGPFQIEVTNITGSSAHLSIVPDRPDMQYYFDVCTRQAYERYGVAEIVADYYKSLMENYPGLSLDKYLEGSTSIGADEDEVYNLPDDTDMVCYAIEVSNDCKPVGTPSVVAFHTLKAGDPEDCRFELAVTGVRSTEATVYVIPSDGAVTYWYGCYAVKDWPGDAAIPTLVKEALDETSSMTGRHIEEVVQMVTFRGSIQMDESGFEPSTRYYLYAYAMDKEGNPAGPLFKETFATLDTDYSDANVSLTYRYFDGTELKAMYPDKFANAEGKVIVQAFVTPNELTAHYAWGMLPGDYTDEQSYPEESAKNALLQSGWVNIPGKNIYANWGEATFMYFGADAWGIDGKLNRLLVDIDRAGVRPASEYEDLESAMSIASPMKLKGYQIEKVSPIARRMNLINKKPAPFRKCF